METIIKEYYNYIMENRGVKYSVSFDLLPSVLAIRKWAGVQSMDNGIYGIPNDMNAILKHTSKGTFYLGKLGDEPFKWTGGCVWNGFLYGFPRTSNYLLKMALNTETIELIHIGKEYLKEHHYGGVCTKNGIIYQPPRDTDHILIWDLKREKTERICLTSKPGSKSFRYCGSILHPNGYIYLLPELNERIIQLNARTGEWSFIGEPIDATVFDAKISVDGNIYGFSAYCDGILKIDVIKECAKMIHTEINPGAYGTKLGVNGHLYSIPGNGNHVWDYDPLTDSLASIYQFSQSLIEKYGGGTSMQNGDVYALPIRQNELFKLQADIADLKIPDNIYQNFFLDCY